MPGDGLTNMVAQYARAGFFEDEERDVEMEREDNSCQMWRSNVPCWNCGSTLRHSVPAIWTQCGNCGEDV